MEARGENRPCENCGNVFLSVPRPGRLGGRSRFCSKDCANSRRSALAEWRKPMKTCNVCHAEKEQDKFLERRLTCNDCLGAAAHARRVAAGEPRPCDQCGALFLAAKSHRGLNQYCGRECANAAMLVKVERPCMNCGKIVLRACAAARAFCCQKCRDAHSIGAGHPSWKGGVLAGGAISVYVGRRHGFSTTTWTVHRVVASKVIGRQLTHSEHIIHIDGNKGNNSPGNLFLCESKSEWRRRVIGVTLPWPTTSNLEQIRAAETRKAAPHEA